MLTEPPAPALLLHRYVVARAIWADMLSIAVTYFITLCLFPGLESEIRHCVLGEWLPILVMAVFNLSDFVGKVRGSRGAQAGGMQGGGPCGPTPALGCLLCPRRAAPAPPGCRHSDQEPQGGRARAWLGSLSGVCWVRAAQCPGGRRGLRGGGSGLREGGRLPEVPGGGLRSSGVSSERDPDVPAV